MSADTTADLRAALASDNASIHLVRTFTHGRCLQVFDGKRKAGPVIVPGEGQTLADLLHMLGRLAEPEREQQADPDDDPTEAADLGRGVAGF